MYGRRRLLGLLLAAMALAVSLALAPSSSTSAFAVACYGPSCNGLDPSNRCDHDAITAAAMSVTDGMLELRYSPSCVANWGRYTPYARTASGYAAAGIGIHARVTAWNPGGSSYGTAHHASSLYGSSWSQMVDGRGTACTGVEVVHFYGNGDYQSQGWDWGPCY